MKPSIDAPMAAATRVLTSASVLMPGAVTPAGIGPLPLTLVGILAGAMGMLTGGGLASRAIGTFRNP